MAGEKTVSMQNIADELGISKVTVSKALNGKDGVSEELKEKIYQAAQQKGYILPSYGQRKTRKAGIIMSSRFSTLSDSGKFYMGMYEKIINELRKISCSGVMITPDKESIAEDLETIEKKGMFDGLILLGILDKEVRDRVDAVPLPKVYVDVYDETHKSDSVVTENIYSTYEMTQYLVQMGHREIGFVGTVGATTSITDRYLGYKRALIEQKLPIVAEWEIPDRTMKGEAVEIKLSSTLPGAFICNCDETAFRLVRALKERGLIVPDDVSVVGFDNDIYAELCEPRLTTVAVNMEEIGKMVAKRFAINMEHPLKKEGEIYRVEGRSVFRDSVRDLKGKGKSNI
ncbi:MAG: LacI family DNA-binding transcriptional regulator [Hungatella sp.]|nr:LacI family DNA-binding transcriptional regulator [Hungatella sp.]